MWVKSKMKETITSRQLLNDIFTKNWNEEFLFDGQNDKHVLYGDFFSMVLRGKEQLQKYGLKENNIICLFLNNSLEFIVLLLSSFLLGITIVPIDITKGKNEIQEILNTVNCSLIICDKEVNSSTKTVHINEFSESFNQKNNSDFNQLDNLLKLD